MLLTAAVLTMLTMLTMLTVIAVGDCQAQIIGGPSTISPTTAFQGLPLTNASFPAIRGYALALGNVDLYTVPAGKRLLVISGGGMNPTTTPANIVWYFEVKISGTYYRLMTSITTVATGGGGTNTSSGSIDYILEAGEVLAVNSSALGMNLSASVVLFDATSPMRSVKLIAPASGDNLLYTVPAGKTAWLLGTNGAIWGASALNIIADTTAPGIVNVCNVASGGSAACSASTNAIANTTAVASAKTALITGAVTMSSTDFLLLNVATGNAAQMAWINVLELTTP